MLLLPLFAGVAGAQEDDDAPRESARGRFVNEGEPVEGVGVTVLDDAGDEVGDAESDDDGRWEIPVPGPGDYTVVVDTDSFPDDVNLRNEDENERVVNIRPGERQVANFALGEDTRQVRGELGRLLALTVSGIKFGLVIAMASVGLSMIYGTTGLVNFAHGEIVTFGALMAWIGNQLLGMHLIVATPVAMIVTGLAAGLLDRGLWRPLRNRGTGLVAMLVVSIGLSLLLRYVFLYQFGGRTRPFGDYNLQRGIELGPILVAPKDMWAIGIALVILVLVGLLLQKTRVGKAMRAVSDNPDLAASSGIDVQRVILFVWMAGGALAALGGILYSMSEQVSFQMGFQLLLLMFAGITLGGLGTAYGALAGGFVIGLFVQVSTMWVSPELKTVGALAILILVLLVRPQGILGQAERVG
jgi:neutral amino acid transport system permease protein